MKTLTYLTICLAVCCLFGSNVFACTTALDDSLAPSGTSYAAGAIINYQATLALSGLDDCPITNIVVKFYPPSVSGVVNSSAICDSDGGVVVFDGGALVLEPGDPTIIINSSLGGNASIMNYVVNSDDVVDAEAGPLSLKAYICTTFTALTDIGNLPGQDEKASINVLAINPAVEVTKEACAYSKEGDVITWDIRIENVGTEALLLTSIEDPLLGGDLTAEATAAGCDILGIGDSCQFSVDYLVTGDDQPGPVINEVTVEYEATIDGQTGIGVFVGDSDTAEVTLLHPSFTVDVECLGIDGDFADFEVTFCNTGDVDLLVDPQDPGIQPFLLPVQVDSECSVFVVEVPVQIVCGAASASKTIAPLASIPSEFCELGNIITPDPVEDTATCEVQTNPCFTVEKNCTSTGSLTAGDTATYEIIVTNCGDVSLDFVINDAAAEPPLVDVAVGPIAPGATYNTTVSITVPDCAETGVDLLLNNEVVVDAYCGDGTYVGQESDDADCTYSCGGLEGCTPGFWRNSPNCWCGEYQPGTLVGDVWDIPAELSSLADDTLMDAITYRGGRGLQGAAQILLRAAVASLLNACSEDVDFPLSVGDVIDGGNAALATLDRNVILTLAELLDFANNYGCPISSQNSAYPCQREMEY